MAPAKAPVDSLPVNEWRVFLPFRDNDVVSMFTRRGASIVGAPAMANIVVFTGGADICPLLYGELPIPGTNMNLTRDREEVRLFKALHPDMPKIGICRGAQLLNVMCGGSLWQDVDNHAKGTTHHVYDSWYGIADLHVTSTHHQMMRPKRSIAYEFLSARMSTLKKNQEGKEYNENAPNEEYYEDPEGVYYSNFNSVCFQPHPEYGHKQTEDYFFNICTDIIDWSWWRQRETAKASGKLKTVKEVAA